MRSSSLAAALVAGAVSLSGAAQDLRPAGYTGTIFADARNTGGAQNIPGRVRCALYDRGGEGVAYHDRMPSTTAAAS